MIIEILTIGDEIIDGRRLDTNSAWMGRRLSAWGFPPRFRQSVTDRKEDIAAAFLLAISRSDLVLSTGGLGPTVDDITFESLAQSLERKLTFHPEILERIQNKFEARGLKMSENNRRQAMLPEGSKELSNEKGTAPAICCEFKGKTLMIFPGVPSEMEPIFEREVPSELDRRAEESGGFRSFEESYRFFGLPESELEARVEGLALREFEGVDVRIAYTASFPYVSLTFFLRSQDESKKKNALSQIESKLEKELGRYIAAKGSGTLEEVLVQKLLERGEKVAVAESITGGLLASHFINVSGSSEVFDLGVVAYSNEEKIKLLDVDPRILEEYGAVSEECARAMAEGIRLRSGADFGISTTGIAGPTGSSADKPLGLTYIAWAAKDRTQVQRYEFRWDRNRNRMRATFEALMGLKAILK